MKKFRHEDITDKIIEAFFRVYNALGYGFLEEVHENELMIELKRIGLSAVAQFPIRVMYGGEVAGEYGADVFVENIIIVEINAAKNIGPEHEAQLLKLS